MYCTSLYDMSILTIPTPSDKFMLLTDASARGITGVLRVIREKEELPVGFISRQLRPAEPATELEGLSLVKAIQHFGIYLLGQEFSVETDHKALTYLHTSKHLNGRVMDGHFYYSHLPSPRDTDLEPGTVMQMA